jgi:hypothetical protein
VRTSAHLCGQVGIKDSGWKIGEQHMGKISVLLPEVENARFSAYCRKSGHKKSTFIAHLIKEYLDSEQFQPEGLRTRRSVFPKSRLNISRHIGAGRKSGSGT